MWLLPLILWRAAFLPHVTAFFSCYLPKPFNRGSSRSNCCRSSSIISYRYDFSMEWSRCAHVGRNQRFGRNGCQNQIQSPLYSRTAMNRYSWYLATFMLAFMLLSAVSASHALQGATESSSKLAESSSPSYAHQSAIYPSFFI